MFIAVLDFRNNCVDIIRIDDSMVPSDRQSEWITELLVSKGYSEEDTCWMASDTEINIRTLVVKPRQEAEEERKKAIVDGKTPKNWN